jgi:hypothetical protein
MYLMAIKVNCLLCNDGGVIEANGSWDTNQGGGYTNTTVAYNINDAGNFLWGQAMSRIGITLAVAKLAAYANSITVGDGPDSYSDQAALTRGWSLNVKTSQSVLHKIFMAKPLQINAQGKNKGW